MSEFVRSTVYLYLYEKGLPIKNIGFIKRNVYEKEDKLTIHIKGLYTAKREKGEIFALAGAGETYHCEPMGEIYVENSIGDSRLTIKHDEWHKGIMVHIADKICIAGFEEEKPDIRKIRFAGNDREEVTEKSREEVAEEPMAEESLADESPTEKPSTEEPSTEKPSADQGVEMVWGKLASVFPTVHPFESTVNAEYISITPNELQFFNKKEMQALMSNSFLQHAYYSYKYILLGKEDKGEDNICYHVGVPGTYHEREVMMAKMFGFEKFLCAKKEETAQGCFGYYMKSV